MPKRSINHIGIKFLNIKNVLRMQVGHKPSFYVTISFSALYYLIYSQFCLVQPNTDIFSNLAKDFRENKNLTCKKCTTQSLRTSYPETPNILLIQINRLSTHIVK